MGSMAALPGGAEDYVRDSIESSLGLPVSDRSLRLKLLASEDRRRLLQDHIFSLEEDLRAAAHRIDLLKAESTMNAAGLRRCVQEKEAMATAYRFSKENVHGEGGYGVVYHGRLVNGTEVAINKIFNNMGQAEKEFRVEVEAIGHACPT